MTYQVEYQAESGYLKALVRGERSMDAVMSLAKELIEKALELHRSRLLIDVRGFTGWLKTMEIYNLVTHELPKYLGKGLERVAILDRELPRPGGWFFFETVARNRGFNLKVCSDLESAIAWLVEGPEP